MTERLKTCFDAGGVVALFPILKDWPHDELKALINDCTNAGEDLVKRIDEAWKEEIFKPVNFINPQVSKALDEAKESAIIEAIAVYSEICSVAFHYLGDDLEGVNLGENTVTTQNR